MKDENMLNRRGAETQRENQITEKIIGSAIAVHKALGPGLLKSIQEFSASQRLCGDNL